MFSRIATRSLANNMFRPIHRKMGGGGAHNVAEEVARWEKMTASKHSLFFPQLFDFYFCVSSNGWFSICPWRLLLCCPLT
jgi:hypothetical protein